METNSAADTEAGPGDADPAVLVAADEKDPAVVVLTLNRPAKRNALTIELKEALLTALKSVAADSSVRAVVLAGSGKSFCVGQDLGEHAKALESDPATSLRTVEKHYNPIVTTIATMPKPVIAAINGGAVGAGLGFALACDLRVAADTAMFATAFAAIGLTADSGLSASLVHSLGAARATELLLLGE
nr:enoyl-CoA hydratase/isomerase family protein [Pseudonocardiales bacterium]